MSAVKLFEPVLSLKVIVVLLGALTVIVWPAPSKATCSLTPRPEVPAVFTVVV